MSSNNKTRLRPLLNWLNHWLGKTSRAVTTGWTGKFVGIFLFLLSLGIITSIIVYNWEIIQAYQWQIRPVWLLGVLVFFLLDLLVATWVWHLLVARLANYSNFRRSAKICWRANLARRIPTPVWYIAGRAVMYEQEGVSKTTTSLLSGLELIFFFISGLITTLLILPFWIIPDEMRLQTNQFGLLILLLSATIFFVHPKLLEKLWAHLRPDTPLQELMWRDTIVWLAYYVTTWILGAFVLFSVMNLLQPVSLSHIIPIIGIWSLAGTLSLAGALTISIIGIRELSLTLLLATIVPAPIALIIAILIRIVWMLGEMLSVLLSLRL